MRRVALLAVVLLAACGSSGGGSSDKPNDSVHGSVQSIVVDGQTRKYVCFTYTTVNRGGIWCERITAAPAIPDTD